MPLPCELLLRVKVSSFGNSLATSKLLGNDTDAGAIVLSLDDKSRALGDKVALMASYDG